ncbi:hypothetical protein LOZ36_005352 [Ophidiomyces ophidiicola]|nr:hypothetical protein LOZ36_005352 [Ophidiomyces ophidiicola]
MSKRKIEQGPMSQLFQGVPPSTTCTRPIMPTPTRKSSFQPPYALTPVSATGATLDELSFPHFHSEMFGLPDYSEIHCSPSMSDPIADPYTWDFDVNQVPGDSGIFGHHEQFIPNGFTYPPSQIQTPLLEYSDWFEINKLAPSFEEVESLKSLGDCQHLYRPQELGSPISFQDREVPVSRFDLYGSVVSRHSHEGSASRPGSASYSSFTPDNSMASSPLDNSYLHLQPRSVPDGVLGVSEEDSDSESATSDEPYARLIWKALISAPGHKMTLKEIYEWFEKHTNKAKNPDFKGWQNSIRHNLSMNAAFIGARDVSSPGTLPKKSGNVWVLTESAIKYGVESTTRYRKQGAQKKPTRSENPAPQRQRSGAKGGRATKKAAKFRRALREAQRVEDNRYSSNHFKSEFMNDVTIHTPYDEPHRLSSPAITAKNIAATSYNFDDPSGCTDFSPDSPVFYNITGAAEKSLASGFSTLDQWPGDRARF